MCAAKLHEDYEDQLIGRARQAGQGWVEQEYMRERERLALK